MRLRQIILAAPAKVNLSLRVLGRRPDGLHELDAPTVPLTLADTVTVSVRDDNKIHNTWQLPGTPSNCELGLRAATALARAAQVQQGATIHIDKRVPVGAGLGGGSSDAAAVLLACNRLWGLRWSRMRLAALGATLGADVPFFLHCRQARLCGAGEDLQPLTHREIGWLVLAMPVVACRTSEVFAIYEQKKIQNETIMTKIPTCVLQVNDLLPAAMSLHPTIGDCLASLYAVAGNAAMSGSGSACYARLPNKRTCDNAIRALRGLPWQLLATRIICGRTQRLLGSSQAVRQRILVPSFVGSIPTSPASLGAA